LQLKQLLLLNLQLNPLSNLLLNLLPNQLLNLLLSPLLLRKRPNQKQKPKLKNPKKRLLLQLNPIL
jgi:hypothetical protein